MLGNLLNLASLAYGVSRDRKSDAFEKQKLAQAQGQFDAQMDTTIQRRLKDATAAGVHPLFALGASSGASPTISAGGGALSRGSGVTDALAGISRRLAEEKLQESSSASIANKSRAARDDAEAAFINSKTAQLSQEVASRGRDGTNVKTFPLNEPDVVYGPSEFYAPQVPFSKRTGVRAGTAPGNVEVMMPDGRKVELYDPDLGLDEIGQIKYAYERAIHKGTDAMVAVRNWIARNAGPFHRARYTNQHGKKGIPK